MKPTDKSTGQPAKLFIKSEERAPTSQEGSTSRVCVGRMAGVYRHVKEEVHVGAWGLLLGPNWMVRKTACLSGRTFQGVVHASCSAS